MKIGPKNIIGKLYNFERIRKARKVFSHEKLGSTAVFHMGAERHVLIAGLDMVKVIDLCLEIKIDLKEILGKEEPEINNFNMILATQPEKIVQMIDRLNQLLNRQLRLPSFDEATLLVAKTPFMMVGLSEKEIMGFLIRDPEDKKLVTTMCFQSNQDPRRVGVVLLERLPASIPPL
jgi:hypothetical protein